MDRCDVERILSPQKIIHIGASSDTKKDRHTLQPANPLTEPAPLYKFIEAAPLYKFVQRRRAAVVLLSRW